MPPAPTVEDALRMVAGYEQRHPGYAVLALNTVAGPSLSDLFIAQNELSLTWIGPVARSHAGTPRALIAAEDIPGFVRTMFVLAQRGLGPEGELDTSLRVELVEGTKQLIRLTLCQCDRNLVCVGAHVLR